MLANQLMATAMGGPPSEDGLAFLRAAALSWPKDVDLARFLAEQLIVAADFVPSDEKRRALLNEASGTLAAVVSGAESAVVNNLGNVRTLVQFGIVHQQLCHCLVQLGRREEAISAFRHMVSVQRTLPMGSTEPVAADIYWREVAKAVITMRATLDHQQSFTPDEFLRAHLSEMQFKPTSGGHLGWLVVVAEAELVIRMAPVAKRDGRQATGRGDERVRPRSAAHPQRSSRSSGIVRGKDSSFQKRPAI